MRLIDLRSVDFPAPDGPIIDSNSPFLISKLISFRTVLPFEYSLYKLSIDMMTGICLTSFLDKVSTSCSVTSISSSNEISTLSVAFLLKSVLSSTFFTSFTFLSTAMDDCLLIKKRGYPLLC